MGITKGDLAIADRDRGFERTGYSGRIEKPQNSQESEDPQSKDGMDLRCCVTGHSAIP